MRVGSGKQRAVEILDKDHPCQMLFQSCHTHLDMAFHSQWHKVGSFKTYVTKKNSWDRQTLIPII